MKRLISTLGSGFVILVFATFLSVTAFAQPGSPGNGQDPDEVPITGIEILLVGGGLLGARKVIQRLKNR